MTELVAFALANYPPAREWKDGILLNYIRWATINNFLFLARDNDGSLKGVALARPVSGFPKTDAEFNLDGNTIHVDVMAATDKRAFQLLCFTIIEHYPNCNRITFQRLNRGTKEKSYSVDHARRTLFKTRNIIYGQARQT